MFNQHSNSFTISNSPQLNKTDNNENKDILKDSSDKASYYFIDDKRNELLHPQFIRTNTHIEYSKDFPKEDLRKDLSLYYNNIIGKDQIERKYKKYNVDIEWLTISHTNVDINDIYTTCRIQLTAKANLNAKYSVFIPKELRKTDSSIEIFANSKATFTNCVFQNSTRAALIVRDYSTAIFDHCIFEDNSISCFLMNSSYAKFINCKFKNDKAISIYAVKESRCEIINCEFLDLKGKAIFAKDISEIHINNSCFKNCNKGAVTIEKQSKLLINTATIENSENTALRAVNNSEIRANNVSIYQTNGNAINLDQSNVYFNDCVIKETTFPTIAIFGNNTIQKFQNCSFHNNQHMYLITCKNKCHPLFSNCYFKDFSMKNFSIQSICHPIFQNCYFDSQNKDKIYIYNPTNFNIKSLANLNIEEKISFLKNSYFKDISDNYKTKPKENSTNFNSDYEYDYEEEEEEEENEIHEKLKDNRIKIINLIKYKQGKIIKRDSSSITYEVYELKNNKLMEKHAAKCYLIDILHLPKDDQNQHNFLNEVFNLSQLIHPSIIKFKGCSLSDFRRRRNHPVIVTEFPGNQTLEDIIQKVINKEIVDNWETKKLIIMYGIASGMSYLHSKNIVHRDLNPLNIFIDDYFHPIIAGFDSSAKIDEILNQTVVMGTDPFIAPEILRGEGYRKESDVYSFSIIAYELVMNEIPFSQQNEYQIYNNVALKKIRPHIDNNIDAVYHDLIELCWSDNVNIRPSFDKIRINLKKNRNFITKNVDENLFQKYVKFIDNHIDGLN